MDEGRGMSRLVLGDDWLMSGEGRAKVVEARMAAARAEVKTVYILVVFLKRVFGKLIL